MAVADRAAVSGSGGRNGRNGTHGSSGGNGRAGKEPVPEQLPPHSLEAEQAVLGAALISRPAVACLLELLERDDFYLGAHRKLFDAIAYLAGQEQPVDTFSVPDRLRELEELESVGGLAYIHGLPDQVPTATNAAYYASVVGQKSVLRQIIRQRDRIRDGADDETVESAIAAIEGLWPRYQAFRELRSGRRKEQETFTLDELLRMEFPPPKWAVPDLLPEGLNLLVAKSKIGKSWMAYQLGLAIITGGLALGRIEVEPGEVLCLMLEDTLRRMQSRVQVLLGEESSLAGEWRRRMHLAREWDRMDGGGKERLRRFLREHPDTRFVVIDTLERFRAARADGNAYAEDYAALVDIKAIADEFEVCILLIHHENKGGRKDYVDSVSGSAGVPAAADSTLVLKRDRDEDRALLHITGRDVEERTLALRWQGLTAGRFIGWELLGDAAEVARTQEEEQVLDILRAAGQPMRYSSLISEIVEETGIKSGSAKSRVSRMVDRGRIVSQSGLYWLPRGSGPDEPEGATTATPATRETPATPATRNHGAAPDRAVAPVAEDASVAEDAPVAPDDPFDVYAPGIGPGP